MSERGEPIDCPVCRGTGYVDGDDGGPMICLRCEGTGVAHEEAEG